MKLVCFDLDGTLIDEFEGHEYWGTLHRTIEGEVGQRKNLQRMADYKAGKISYRDWVDLDLGDFQKLGATKADFEKAAQKHALFPGAKEAVRELHARGYKLAVISGSLNIFIDFLFPDHPFDDVFANEVWFDDEGKIAGWKDTVYEDGAKHKALRMICEREGIDIKDSVFVGNYDNDIDAMEAAGFAIAFLPKSEGVRAVADVVIEKKDVREILKHI